MATLTRHTIKKGGFMNHEPMTPDEILDMLKRGKNSGYIVGDIPSNDAEAGNLALLLHEELKSQANKNQTDSAAGIESGRQDFVLKLDPKAPFDSNHDRRLEIFLAGPEWSAIFYTVLGCTGGEPFVAGDDINEWTEKHRREFQRAIPHYPMLGRIWDTYINVSYQAEEITALKNECLKVKASTSNAIALQGLDKLIYTCDEALKSGLGLYLAAD